jgi:RNA-binding protein
MLTTKNKCFLRSLAQTIKPTFQIGKDGITKDLVESILNYLNRHELVKVSILQNSLVDFEICKAAFEKCDIEIVQTIGRQIVLYKQSDNAINPIRFPKVNKK